MAPEGAVKQGHPIKVAVRRTGLSPHVIRVWEKRYGAVTPQRTPTNRRLYSDADIQRLLLLRKATLAGHSISHIANLPTDRLFELVTTDEAAAPPPAPRALPETDAALFQSHLEACIAATERLDTSDLEAALLRARVALSQPAFIEHLLVPLMEHIGELWRDGSLRIMHEHLASAVVRTLLGGSLAGAFDTPSAAPNLIVTTPAGQLHEIGALMVAATATSEGWGITYLGPNLPAEDIAAAAQQKHARAVALSIVHPADDPRLEHELTKLHRYLTPQVGLLVGGRASEGYQEALEAIGARRLPDLPSLRAHLEALRSGNA